jgi:hypothetical protein
MAWAFIIAGCVIATVSPVLGAITMFPGIVIKLAQRANRTGRDR